MLDQPGVERGDAATKALARVLTPERPRTLQPHHAEVFGGATREELRELRVRPRLPIHDRDQLVPGIRSKLEAGAVGEQALGALTAAGDQELRQRLAVGVGGAIEELPVPVLDPEAEALAFDSRGFLGGASHETNVHTLYVIAKALGQGPTTKG